jgi:hypothetical protein
MRATRPLLLALITLASTSCALLGQRPQPEGILVTNAQLQNPHYLQQLDQRTAEERTYDRTRYGVYAHRIERGEGWILGYRHFDPGELMAVDDETFEKLTLWLPNPPPAGAQRIQLETRPDIIAIHTSGGSAWAQNACSSRIIAGTLTLTPRGRGRIGVELKGRLQPTGNRGVWDTCRSDSVELSFLAEQIELERLTPWVGREGEFVYQETHP